MALKVKKLMPKGTIMFSVTNEILMFANLKALFNEVMKKFIYLKYINSPIPNINPVIRNNLLRGIVLDFSMDRPNPKIKVEKNTQGA